LDDELAGRVVSEFACRTCGVARRGWLWVLAEGPGRAVVLEAEGDESAQVECGGAVMQPVVVFGHAPVAEFAVASGEPGDRAFDHRPALAVIGLPLLVFRALAMLTLQSVVLVQGQ